MNADAISSAAYVGAYASSTSPRSVEAMPNGNEYGIGLRSVNTPISGCSSEAVS